ncbi:hypothetical protein [Paraburkholderia kururiensis]|uniref:hypothetical protein n=1 Tax=Paraburkholderia kururiensis TaxID=984307 RepID=UPI00034B383F|nr:hypothetical protein [Paraburkholderia kururiensis]
MTTTLNVLMDEIDQILLDWYEWSQKYDPAPTYRSADSTCGGFRSSRQWMSYEELDEEVESNFKATIGRAVEPFIFQLSMRHRVAIQAQMLNFQAGVSVWCMARSTREDYDDAKQILKPMLRAHGILGFGR